MFAQPVLCLAQGCVEVGVIRVQAPETVQSAEARECSYDQELIKRNTYVRRYMDLWDAEEIEQVRQGMYGGVSKEVCRRRLDRCTRTLTRDSRCAAVVALGVLWTT